MKHSSISKLIALLLAICVVLVPTLATIGSAAETGKQTCPYIYIHGFMGTDLYKDPSAKDSEKVWPPDGDAILEAVKACLPSLLEVLITRNWDKFGDVLLPYVYDLFAPAMLAEDGTVKDGSGPHFSYPSSVSKTSQLSFRYDWRIDPRIVASQLNDFIEYVCKKSGCDQVCLECHSYGGVITTTYAELFDSKRENTRIKSVCYNTTAVFGETYTGELLTGKIIFNDEAVTEYLKMMLATNEYHNLISSLFDLLKGAGITEDLCDLGNELVENLGVRASKEVLAPLFAGWLSIWSMVADNKIDEAQDYIFNTLYKDDGIDHSGLLEKVNGYNTEVRPYKAQRLKAINDKSNLYVISRYGGCGLFLTESWKTVTDSTVDSQYSSFGATFAGYKEKLSKEYLSGKTAYISPDKTVDASTAMFPDQTWFIRSYPHANNCDDADALVNSLLFYDGQATIDTFEQYPQYLWYNVDTEEIKVDTLQGTQTLTFFDRLKLAIKDIFRLIKSLFNK